MTLSQQTLGILAVSAAALAVLSLTLSLVLGRRLRTVRRGYRRRAADPAAAPRLLDDLPADLREIAMDLSDIREVLGHAVQSVGLVRFDAFDDMGGKLSFAAALLDGEGDGIVLSSINGRSETRIYAKPVDRGSSRVNLSEEEEEAIRRALGAVRR